MKDSTEFPLVIVGKNSKLYGYYSQAIKKRFKVGIELSHSGMNRIPTDSNVVLFSFDRKSLEANLKLVSVISNRIRGKLIYISTSAVFANIYTTRYLYPKLKGDIEINVLNNHGNTVIVRVGIPHGLSGGPLPSGRVLVTDESIILDSISRALINEKCRIVNAFKVNETRSTPLEVLYNVQRFLHRRPVTAIWGVAIDIVMKMFGLKQYGYTLLSNYCFLQTNRATVVVGGGISAYARASTKGHNGVLIYPSGKIDSILDQQGGVALERIGGSGNSGGWHGVISLLSNYKYSEKEVLLFKERLKYHYALSEKECGYILNERLSFVPKRPLRPKHIKHRVETINDRILAIENEGSDFIAHGVRGEYKSRDISLCTGSLALLNILNVSGFLSGPLVFDDHMVGYFGQLKFGNKTKFKVVKTKRGHFKKYIKISLKSGKVFYLTIRPAYGKFKDLSYAANYRSIFSNDAFTVVSRLLTKMSLPLIGEALFNKFGLSIKTRYFNIVGHVEMKDNVVFEPQSNSSVSYITRVVELSYQERCELRTKLEEYQFLECTILEKIDVSPGLHFVNGGDILRDKIPPNINVLSTLSLPSSVEHPTFTQYIKSSLK